MEKPKNQQLKEYAADLGCTSKELAEYFEVSLSTITKWRAGKPQPPKAVLLTLEMRLQIVEFNRDMETVEDMLCK